MGILDSGESKCLFSLRLLKVTFPSWDQLCPSKQIKICPTTVCFGLFGGTTITCIISIRFPGGATVDSGIGAWPDVRYPGLLPFPTKICPAWPIQNSYTEEHGKSS